jgi:hypothetical protein
MRDPHWIGISFLNSPKQHWQTAVEARPRSLTHISDKYRQAGLLNATSVDIRHFRIGVRASSTCISPTSMVTPEQSRTGN